MHTRTVVRAGSGISGGFTRSDAAARVHGRRTRLGVLITLLLSGVATSLAAQTASGPVEYRIGIGDVLEIAVWKNDTMTRTVPVRPDGRISLPLVNDVPAAGLTPQALRDSLSAKLSAYIADPVVSVIVREVNSFKVSVIGQVKTPGRVNISGQTTVLDAIAQAGGFTEFASRSRIVLLRGEKNGTRRIPVDYDRIIDGGGMDNYPLFPGDIVVVP